MHLLYPFCWNEDLSRARAPINGWNTVYDTWVVKVVTAQGYDATSQPIMLAI
jgi:hypothetical protein